jgi:hypothetical protein
MTVMIMVRDAALASIKRTLFAIQLISQMLIFAHLTDDPAKCAIDFDYFYLL